jgi:hypothetical protein
VAIGRSCDAVRQLNIAGPPARDHARDRRHRAAPPGRGSIDMEQMQVQSGAAWLACSTIVTVLFMRSPHRHREEYRKST